MQLGGGGDDATIPEEAYTPAMQTLADYSREVGSRLLGFPITVRLVNARHWKAAHSDRAIVAAFRDGLLILNVPLIRITNRRAVHKILLHEFAHHVTSDHLSEEYHDALCALGADLAELALEEPELAGAFGPAASTGVVPVPSGVEGIAASTL
jgi:hypothetical protein